MEQNYKKDFTLLKERNFGEVLNDTINFIKAYGQPLYKTIAYLILPLSLLYGIFLGLFTKNLNSTMLSLFNRNSPSTPNPFDILLSWSYGGAILLGITESLLIIVVVYGFFALFRKGEREFSINTIWAEARTRILPTIGTIIVLGLAMGILFFLFSMLMGLFMVAFASSAGGPFIMFLLIIIMMIGLGAIVTFFSMALPAAVIEKKGAFSAIERSFSLVSGNWGQTFLVLFIGYIVIMVITSVFALPSAVAQGFITFNSLEGGEGASPLMSFIVVIGSCLSTVGGALVTPILHICVAMQFFNLVERKEGLGMKEMIETFGTKQAEDDIEEEY